MRRPVTNRQSQSGHGSKLAEFVMLPDGTGYLVKVNHAALSPNDTYQLGAS